MKLGEFKRIARWAAKHANLRDAGRRKRVIFEKQAQSRNLKRRADRAIGKDLYLEIPDKLKLTEDYVDTVSNSCKYNDLYSEYYYRWYEETNISKFLNLSNRVHACHQFWFGDRYNMQRVFDIKSVNLCHDKFCVNCQHLKQASRLKRFTEVFETLRHDYDLYHFIFTVKNVPGERLKETIDKSFEAFKKLMRYFSGDAKIKGLDFKQYGYAGAVRSLEIVAKPTEYHPHIHAAILLRKGLQLEKKHINTYSFNNGILQRKFSDLEILIQKIVFLIMHGIKIQSNTVRSLPLGYSCVLNLVEDDEWKEVFKYVTKLTDNENPYLSDTQFRTLYNALYRCKVMQGYGLLYRVAENDADDDEVALEYAKILAKLRALEEPEECSHKLDEVVSNIHEKRMTYISKRQVQAWLNELAADEKKDDD